MRACSGFEPISTTAKNVCSPVFILVRWIHQSIATVTYYLNEMYVLYFCFFNIFIRSQLTRYGSDKSHKSCFCFFNNQFLTQLVLGSLESLGSDPGFLTNMSDFKKEA
jgi:hypothetical protein